MTTSERLAVLLQSSLRTLLEDPMIIVEGIDLYPALGWYRTSNKADCYRWAGTFRRGPMRCSIGSYDTMTSCCRGLTIKMVKPYDFEVHATN